MPGPGTAVCRPEPPLAEALSCPPDLSYPRARGQGLLRGRVGQPTAGAPARPHLTHVSRTSGGTGFRVYRETMIRHLSVAPGAARRRLQPPW